MDKRLRLALTAYLSLWAAIAAGVIYGIVRAGYSIWLAVTAAFLMFFIVNGSLSYGFQVRKLRAEGKPAPRYFQYLLFPKGRPKFKDEAPGSTHVLVGIAAMLLGGFILFCGIALVWDGQWSRISEPYVVAASCAVVIGVGASLLYSGWKILISARRLPDDAA